ncbi:hypothetical protein KMZ29_09235 [Bradyrhizobium sediminis]|uniref:Uncharacterized protein n=1 Tax=Bradyrhizobium sediminis TaxID=2840469 RepID=A0A975NGP9_9BRAD|nr:hypothetical protein [Bradyrhizobium sediminis]QWG14813.1 hypothetical protein KMZ29_09235 [Bradyrhizobium sediminis]
MIRSDMHLSFRIMFIFCRHARTRRHAAWQEPTLARGPAATIHYADRVWDTVRAGNDCISDHAAHFIHTEAGGCMTAYLIALALAGLVTIAVWEGFQ